MTQSNFINQCLEGVTDALRYYSRGPSQVVLVVKNPPANVGGARDNSLIPGLGRSSGE